VSSMPGNCSVDPKRRDLDWRVECSDREGISHQDKEQPAAKEN
jgi:hypothetical protein